MTFNRRNLLKSAGGLLVGASLPNLANPNASVGAADGPKRKLVMVLASGGWDPTYCLDPKPGSTLVDAPPGEVRQFGNLSVLTHAERPSVTSFFERFGEVTAVVNGLQVRSFVHSDCMKRVLTGTPSELNPDFAAVAAYELGKSLPVPYFVLGNSALSGSLAAYTGRAGTTNQLSSLLKTDDTPDPFFPKPGFRATDQEEALVQSYLKKSGERLEATRGQVGSNRRAIQAFLSSLERRTLLKKFAQERGSFGLREYTPDLGVQIRVALDALSVDLSQTVMLEMSDWDTHQDNSQQSQKHELLFQGLSELMQGLMTRQLLDRTVVVVLSEMGRTPQLNQGQGKDHWPVTSAMVLGGGIVGGRQYGATDAGQRAVSVSFTTGSPDNAGKQLQTSSFIAGILAAVGVSSEPYLPGVEAFHAFLG